jgi:DNA-binding GntR family transcriptional regulator
MSDVAGIPLKLPTRQTLADSITESLRDAICGGLLPAGQRLAEARLAASLKVSRAPVREALATLELEGLVSRTPGGGATVTRLSRKDVEEIWSLRLPLEVLAVRLAARHGGPRDWARLAENVRATEPVTDPQQLAEKDLEFHEAIVRASGHGRLLASWLQLRSQIRLIMVQWNLAHADSPRGTVRGHKELLRAMQAGDEDAAAAVAEQLLCRQTHWILKSYPDDAPTPVVGPTKGDRA